MPRVLVESGFSSSGSKLTYVTLNKIASVVDTYDTCANRLEDHFYKIEIHSDQYTELNRLIDQVETTLDQSTLTVQNRRILSVHFEDKEIEEVSPGLYYAALTYNIMAQKDYAANLYNNDIEDETLYQKLVRLNERGLNIVITKYGHETWKRPFLSISEMNSFDDWRTTKSRVETYTFGIMCESYNPLEVEDILEDIDNVLSHSNFSWRGRRFTSVHFTNATLEEIEPEIWRGQINFETMVEKDLV